MDNAIIIIRPPFCQCGHGKPNTFYLAFLLNFRPKTGILTPNLICSNRAN